MPSNDPSSGDGATGRSHVVAESGGFAGDCDDDGDVGTDLNEFDECVGSPAPVGLHTSPGVRDNMVATMIVSGVSASILCLGTGLTILWGGPATAVLLPWIGGLCAASAITAFAGYVGYTFDPTDLNYNRIAFPASVTVNKPDLRAFCKRYRKANCPKLTAAIVAYESAAGRVASFQEAVAISENRFQTAQRKGAVDSAISQLAAYKEYESEITAATPGQNAKALALGNLLRASGMPTAFKASDFSKLMKLFAAGRLPSTVISRVNTAMHLTRADDSKILTDMSRRILASRPPIDIAKILSRPLSASGYRTDSRGLALTDLSSVVRTLSSQGALPGGTLGDEFTNVYERTLATCDPVKRSATATKLRHDIPTVASPPAASFLLGALNIAIQFNRPWWGAIPPTVPSFDATSLTSPSTVTFADHTDAVLWDPSEAVCWSWTFGDPASGTANSTPFTPSTHASHTFSQLLTGGAYVVTERVADIYGDVSTHADAIGNLNFDSSTIRPSIAIPGERGQYVFNALAGQRVALTTTQFSMPGGMAISIVSPDGTQLYDSFINPGDQNWSDTLSLPLTGTYDVVFDPQNMDTGSFTAQLATVPPDISGVLAANAPPLSVTTTVPGQNATLTFTGTAGTRVALTTTQFSMPDGMAISIVSPDGTQVYDSFISDTADSSGSLTLPMTGTYKVIYDPQLLDVGSFTSQLVSSG